MAQSNYDSRERLDLLFKLVMDTAALILNGGHVVTFDKGALVDVPEQEEKFSIFNQFTIDGKTYSSPDQHLGGGTFGQAFRFDARRFGAHGTDEDVAVKVVPVTDVRQMREVLMGADVFRLPQPQMGSWCYDVSAIVVGKTLVAHFVMKEFEGGDLFQAMHAMSSADSPYPWIRHVVTQIARDLKALHKLNIVHHDLKPENVMLNTPYVVGQTGPFPSVRVIDVGTSSLQRDTYRRPYIGRGTPRYKPPEACLKGLIQVDAAARLNL